MLGEFNLADGSALRVGTAEWLTPQGRPIWHEGIAPDVRSPSPTASSRSPRTTFGGSPPPKSRSMQDSELAKALEIVSTEAVASDSP